jgi:hypothetical protein
MLRRISKLTLGTGVALLLIWGTALVAKDEVVLPPSWTTTRVTYNISVKELAKRYYGDANDYKLILKANKDILRGKHIVPKNTEIKIPITSKFRDQPEKLGWNSPN